MAHSHGEDVLADFVHQLRQPLGALEALTSYLDLIAAPEDARFQEQLRRMHAEIDHADQILRDGLRTLRAHFSADVPPVVPRADVVDELTLPLTKAAIASVTN